MPVKLAKVRLDLAGRGTVELDGQKVPGVRAVAVKMEVGCRPVIMLEVLAREVDVKQLETLLPDEEVTDAAP